MSLLNRQKLSTLGCLLCFMLGLPRYVLANSEKTHETGWLKLRFEYVYNGVLKSTEKIVQCDKTSWPEKTSPDAPITPKVAKLYNSEKPSGAGGGDVDLTLEDGSGIRLRFRDEVISSICFDSSYRNMEGGLNSHRRYFPSIYWVDNVKMPTAIILYSLLNRYSDNLVYFNGPLKPKTVVFTELKNQPKHVESAATTELSEIFKQNSHCSWDQMTFRVFEKRDWSKISSLRVFLENQKRPVVLDPRKFPQIRPLYSFSEDINDTKWERPVDVRNLTRQEMLEWRGDGSEWRSVGSLRLRIWSEESKNQYYAVMAADKYWRLVKSKNIAFTCLSSSTSDDAKYLKIRIGETEIDLNRYRYLLNRFGFGLFVYDPNSENLFQVLE